MYKGFVISPKKIQEYVFEGKVSRIIQQILEVNIKLTRTVAPPGGTPIYNGQGCSAKFSKETPKSYHIGCGSSQFYSLKVTSEIFIHRNNTGVLKTIAKGQQVLL